MRFKQALGQTYVTTLVERVSRFTLILKNPNRRTKPVIGKIMKAIKELPHVARRPGSVTPLHRGRKARWRTPIEGLDVGCPAKGTSDE